MDRAELWIPPNYCIQMPTVISSVPTAEGFVIGSDGRSRSLENEIISDDTQKIFAVDRPGVRLAYGLFGTAKIGNEADGVLFDFEVQIPRAIERIGIPKNWWEFLSAFARELTDSLRTTCAGLRNELDPESMTVITMGGFYGKFLKLGDVQFCYRTQDTEGEPRNYQQGFSFPWGSITLFDLMNAGDARFARYAQPTRVGLRTLQSGIERVHKDILLHYDPVARRLDEKCCSHIGGRVQIATVTLADGFEWVPGFEPAGLVGH